MNAALASPLARYLGAGVVLAAVAGFAWLQTARLDAARAHLPAAVEGQKRAVEANASLLADNARREREALDAAERDRAREIERQALAVAVSDLSRRLNDQPVAPDCRPRPGELDDLRGFLRGQPAAVGGRQ